MVVYGVQRFAQNEPAGHLVRVPDALARAASRRASKRRRTDGSSPPAVLPTPAPSQPVAAEVDVMAPEPVHETTVETANEPAPLSATPSAVASLDRIIVSAAATSLLADLLSVPQFAGSIVRHKTAQLSQQAVARLEGMGFARLLAVQAALAPLLLQHDQPGTLLHPRQELRDICVTSPTGSGKTLSYVIPVVEAIRSRSLVALRAVVILPTAELCHQVRDVFLAFAKGTDLHVVSAIPTSNRAGRSSRLRDCAQRLGHADVLITTPGRLENILGGLKGTPFAQLRFLIIDEADRMVGPVLQEGLLRLEQAARGPPLTGTAGDRGSVLLAEQAGSARRFQKVLFSATLTDEPARLAPAGLRRPLFITVTARDGAHGPASGGSFGVPEGLTERYTVVQSDVKPLTLVHLAGTQGFSRALCFCKSVDKASRLAEFISCFKGATKPSAEVLSADLSIRDRHRVLERFKQGSISMLICSDVAARGIDLPEVSHVVNFDAPTDLPKYIHRVGRTARAGRSGEAWTLVEPQEALRFKNFTKAQTGLRRHRVTDGDLEPLMPPYRAALKEMAMRRQSS